MKIIFYSGENFDYLHRKPVIKEGWIYIYIYIYINILLLLSIFIRSSPSFSMCSLGKYKPLYQRRFCNLKEKNTQNKIVDTRFLKFLCITKYTKSLKKI